MRPPSDVRTPAAIGAGSDTSYRSGSDRQFGSVANSPPGGLGAAIAAVWLLGSWQLTWVPLNWDAGWLLYVAERVLGGDRLYVDVVENNPPLIIWVSMVPVAVARAFGIPASHVFEGAVLALAALSTALSVLVVRKGGTAGDERLASLLLLGLPFVLLVVPGDSFGEREHLMAAAVLPYLFLAAGRCRLHSAKPGFAFGVGILAGVGLALKPYFILLFLAVELLVLLRTRRWRTALWPEAVAVVAVHVAYLASIFAFAADYFRVVEITLQVYGAFEISARRLLALPWTLVPLGLIAGTLVLRPSGLFRDVRLTMSTGALALLGSALLQQKGWQYQFYPALALATLAVILAVADVLARPGAHRIALQRVGAACLILIAGMFAAGRAHVSQNTVYTKDLLRPAVEPVLPNGSVFVFSTEIGHGFPLVNETGVRWASRFPSLWMLPGLYPGEIDASRPFPYRAPSEWGGVERYVAEAVLADLQSSAPDVLIVDRSPRQGGFGWSSFDYIEYFSQDPRFAAVFAEYQPGGRIGHFSVFYRRASPHTSRGRESPCIHRKLASCALT